MATVGIEPPTTECCKKGPVRDFMYWLLERLQTPCAAVYRPGLNALENGLDCALFL
jgi:hypothetical protein